MTAESLDRFHEYNIKFCKKAMEIKHGLDDLLPRIVAVKDNKIQTYLVTVGGEHAGDAIEYALHVAEKTHPDMISIMTTSWYISTPFMNDYEKFLKEYKHGDVGRSKDKQEALLVITADKKETKMYAANIIRKHNKVYVEEDPELAEMSEMAGRMVPEIQKRLSGGLHS